MFAIDLLKGQGVPAKSRPEGVAAVIVTISFPVIVAVVMVGSFFANRVEISVAKNKITHIEKELEAGFLGDAVKKQKSFEQETEDLTGRLTDVADAVNTQTQWSPFLEAIIKNMPSSVMLKEIDVKKDSKKVKKIVEGGKDAKAQTIEVAVPIRILHLSLTTNQQNNFDKVVKNYRDSLLADPAVGPKLDDIKVSQECEKVDGKDVISYEIFLVFSPRL
jgi:Tfp pilus assembly protein PilN